MPVPPETRSSLIARLTNLDDNDAWHEFAAIYEPFIYRQARHYGLQDADARELVQEVFIAVSKAVKRFTVNRDRGRFRTWLYAIGRNVSLQRLARLKGREQATGDPDTTAAIAATADPASLQTGDIDRELMRHIFLWVTQEVRHDFEPRTWQSFWRTAVENHSIQSTAEELQTSVGAVYVARSRVMARLRSRVQELLVDGYPDSVEAMELFNEMRAADSDAPEANRSTLRLASPDRTERSLGAQAE